MNSSSDLTSDPHPNKTTIRFYKLKNDKIEFLENQVSLHGSFSVSCYNWPVGSFYVRHRNGQPPEIFLMQLDGSAINTNDKTKVIVKGGLIYLSGDPVPEPLFVAIPDLAEAFGKRFLERVEITAEDMFKYGFDNMFYEEVESIFQHPAKIYTPPLTSQLRNDKEGEP